METQKITVDNEEQYQKAVNYLAAGELVAFPTETVYGLGAVATNEQAVANIFNAKGRPSDNPLIVHIGNAEDVEKYCEHIPAVAKKCMAAFWPGPLTLVMPVKPDVLAKNVTAGLSTVGMRMPEHPVALRLLQLLKQPVAAPSANKSGKPSPTTAAHVMEDLQGKIAAIVDGGATGIGLESTVLDVTHNLPVILRPGGVTAEMLRAEIGEVAVATDTTAPDAPRAPGMKYTHYAPDAPVYMIEPNSEKIRQAVEQLTAQGEQVALLAPTQIGALAPIYFDLGDQADLASNAIHLYHALRACNHTEATIILATTVPQQDVGVAIMNRLQKASGGKTY